MKLLNLALKHTAQSSEPLNPKNLYSIGYSFYNAHIVIWWIFFQIPRSTYHALPAFQYDFDPVKKVPVS
jgi:hypothetical protein